MKQRARADTDPTETVDVLVVGGGPSGSTLAARLARLGHRTLLVERSAFPRPRLGESLTPGVLPLLGATGAVDRVMSAGFTAAPSVMVDWDEGPRSWSGMAEAGLLVDRGHFDALLLDQARAAGVRVVQPGRVHSITRAGDRWRAKLSDGGGSAAIEARFVADASGRAGALPGARRRMGPRTLALYGYWSGPGLPETPRIEAARAAWLWGVPLPGGTYNTLVFLDGAKVRTVGRAGLTSLLRAHLAASQLVAPGSGATLVGPVRAADATPYLHAECATECSIRVGEAALALDPISSSGVQKAIQSAVSAAVVVNTLLRRPDSGAAAIAFHRESLTRAARRHRAWAASHYSRAGARWPGSSFWRARSADAPGTEVTERLPPPLDAPLRLSSQAAFVDEPCVVGDFIEVREAVSHPALDGPVAFLGGRPLAPLLRSLPDQVTPTEAARRLAIDLPPDSGLAVLTWLIRHGIVEATASR